MKINENDLLYGILMMVYESQQGIKEKDLPHGWYSLGVETQIAILKEATNNKTRIEDSYLFTHTEYESVRDGDNLLW